MCPTSGVAILHPCGTIAVLLSRAVMYVISRMLVGRAYAVETNMFTYASMDALFHSLDTLTCALSFGQLRQLLQHSMTASVHAGPSAKRVNSAWMPLDQKNIVHCVIFLGMPYPLRPGTCQGVNTCQTGTRKEKARWNGMHLRRTVGETF